MPHFVLIDRLLDRVGGHNFQYALDVLRAAELEGYQPVLATRREFRCPAIPQHWKVLPLFNRGWHRRYLAGVDGSSRRPIAPSGQLLPTSSSTWQQVAAQLLDRPWRPDRERCLEDLSSGCAAIFAEIGFDPRDVVVLPTASDFELLGLIRFLARTPASTVVDWHLQFHFDLFDSNDTPLTTSTTLLRQQFRYALQQVPDHRLHFYATTPQIAAQYERLHIAKFQPLPYPVSQDFMVSGDSLAAREARSPLRITCAGAMRREKGKQTLRSVMDTLSDSLEAGGLQVWMQATPRAARRFLGRRWSRAVEFRERDLAPTTAPIVALQPGLSREDYVQLIRQADIGLFVYGAQRYRARCSGVLVEMLAAGKPVVVPERSWLAEQVADAGKSSSTPIGLASDSAANAAKCIEEIATWYDDFQTAATEFSATWRMQHAAVRTVEQLQANSSQPIATPASSSAV